MPGVKGMGRETKHRAFTYKEKKFNSFGKSGLEHYFRQKFDAQKIQDHFIMKEDYDMTMVEAKRIARHMEYKQWEEDKEFITNMVDTILHLSRVYEISNIEAFAMTCYVYETVGKIKDNNPHKLGDIMDKTLKRANKLRYENWDSFMAILKLIR